MFGAAWRAQLLAMIAALSLPARAEDTWKQHYERGATLFDLEKYPDAAKEFETAYEMKQNPAFLFNIGQSYRLAGKAEKAIGFYKTYLRKQPAAANRAEVEARIAELEKLVEQQRKAAAEPPHGTIETAPAAPPAAAPAPTAPAPLAAAAPPPAAAPMRSQPTAPEPLHAAPAPMAPPSTAHHFALRGGFGAATGVLGAGIEIRPGVVGFSIGSGVYAGTAGLTFGPSDNNGGLYVDAVAVWAHPGVLGVQINTGFGAALSIGWDLRPFSWLSLKLGVGAARNTAWKNVDSKPHFLTFDAAMGPVF